MQRVPSVAPRNPPREFLSDCILQVQGAIDFAEAAYPRKAWQALHLNLTFSKLSVLKDRKVFIPLYA